MYVKGPSVMSDLYLLVKANTLNPFRNNHYPNAPEYTNVNPLFFTTFDNNFT